MDPGALALAIDLGTSGPKVALVAENGAVLDHEFRPVALHLLPGGGAEQDPKDWWTAISEASRQLMSRHPERRASIVGVGVTAQWSGTVALDAQGTPLGRALIWMDSRGAPHTAHLVGGPVSVQGYSLRRALKWIRLTGGAPGRSGKDTLSHLLYLKEAEPARYRSTSKFLEPKDYINFRLTGEMAASYDSAALCWVTDNRNLNEVRYHDDLLKLTGLNRSQLPALCPATHPIGHLSRHVAQELDLPPELPVIAGTPDAHAAAIGAGTTELGALHLYVGTSSWISCHTATKKTDVLRNMAALPSALPGRILRPAGL